MENRALEQSSQAERGWGSCTGPASVIEDCSAVDTVRFSGRIKLLMFIITQQHSMITRSQFHCPACDLLTVHKAFSLGQVGGVGLETMAQGSGAWTDCSYRNGSSQPPVTPVLVNPVLSSGLCRCLHTCDRHTHMHAHAHEHTCAHKVKSF